MSAVKFNLKDYEASAEWAEKAVALTPRDPLANYNLGRAYYTMSKFKKAIPPLEIACRKPKYFQWPMMLGIAYYKTKQPEKAIQAYYQALKMNPDHGLIYSNMGAAYMQLKQYDEAQKYWKKAISLNPKLFDAYNNLIAVSLNMRDVETVKQALEGLKKNGGKPAQRFVPRLKHLGLL